MSINFNTPIESQTVAARNTSARDAQIALARWLEGVAVTGAVAGIKRLSNGVVEEWSGTAWVEKPLALSASHLNRGIVPDARFPATLPALSGINLTALNASALGSGIVPDARFPATLPAVSGANLTALNASALGSGTVPDARFPAQLNIGVSPHTEAQFNLRAPDLGTTAGSLSLVASLMASDNNATRLWISNRRWASGTDHETSETLLHRRVDVTDMGFIAFRTHSARRVVLGHTVGTDGAWLDGSGVFFCNGVTSSGPLVVGARAHTPTVTVAFSATPTFDAHLSNYFEFGTMTANVTGSTVINPVGGHSFSIRCVQDATGGRTFALPAGASVTGSIDTRANAVSYLQLTYSTAAARWEGTWIRITP